MAEERITEKLDGDGKVIERTVQREVPQTVEVRNSGSGAMIWGLLALVAVAFAAYLLFAKNSAGDAQKDDSIANAAEKIGESADKVGESAKKVGDAAANAVEDVAK